MTAPIRPGSGWIVPLVLPDPRGLLHEICQNRSGPITVMALLGSRSSVITDLDGYGDVDIVPNDFTSQPQMLISDLAQRRSLHWIAVKLVGSVSNRMAWERPFA